MSTETGVEDVYETLQETADDEYLQPVNTYGYEHVTTTSPRPVNDVNYLSLVADDEHYTPLTTSSSPAAHQPGIPRDLPPAYKPPDVVAHQQPAINTSQAPPGSQVVMLVMNPGQQHPQQHHVAVLANNSTAAGQLGKRDSHVAAYSSRQSLVLGVILVCVGVLSIVFNIVDVSVEPRLDYDESVGVIGHGIWTGVLCVVSGGLAVGAGKTKLRCLVVAALVMSILTSVACLAELITAAVGAGIMERDVTSCEQTGMLSRHRYSYSGESTPRPRESDALCNTAKTIYAMEILLAILGVIGGVLCIWVSALGCRRACCCNCCSCCCCCVPESVATPANYSYGVPVTFVNSPDSATVTPNHVIMTSP